MWGLITSLDWFPLLPLFLPLPYWCEQLSCAPRSAVQPLSQWRGGNQLPVCAGVGWSWAEKSRGGWSSCVAAPSHLAESITFPGLEAGERQPGKLGEPLSSGEKTQSTGEGEEKLKRYLFYSSLSLQRG